VRSVNLCLCSSIPSLNLDHLFVKNMLRYPVRVAINITNTNWQTQLVWSVGQRHIVRLSSGAAGECSRKWKTVFYNCDFDKSTLFVSDNVLIFFFCVHRLFPPRLLKFRISSEKTFDRNSLTGDHPVPKLVTTHDSSKRKSMHMQQRKLTRLSAQALDAGSTDSASRWICQQYHLRRHENYPEELLETCTLYSFQYPVWRRVEYLHRSSVSPRRRPKGNPVPGGINGRHCQWGT
jgi:hypothetical protein